ncbi:hypothetical protein A3C59_03995 [Candidatus Daviesbacteria bacterium RIFCSPHIGHO2_02_FULL_36_13]|uniref:Uncharacterized protein n=1 Tax=Candidatus Daviesbacteria bacterium RIFCSPHIGHO2_02_FULL_36_13 TaxID=1797768 RepID=A0A1F5JRT1_9BACT|nr:MAG: hypothetical protein A3C59_03995 [Candidatus Daviesbacteria bacterium RIFCSPHIGHO2_02_FULL_36_13]
MNPKLLPEEVQQRIQTISETELVEAREILGETAKKMTDDELRHQIACMEYLSESWLDEFERKTFDGKTLNEKLAEMP